MAKKPEYISLKEAGKLSGYSADYVGQLIRGGKLPGKQVFSNVAWVTTEAAILEYLRKEKGGDTKEVPRLVERLFNPEFLIRSYTILVWVAAGIFVTFALLVVYVFSVGIEQTIDQKYLDEALKREVLN